MKSSRYTVWKDVVGDSKPLVLAGPCSAESRDQVLTTARQLSEMGITLFRAGIWKPRTRPGSFEGVGETGLQWLAEVKEMTSMKVATEVANPYHVEAALKAGVDVFWLGARTVTSPFVVQEVADSLRGTDIPVFVKNPMSADLGLWLGAMERLSAAGISRIGAIHRGVPSSFPGLYRNDPAWNMAIDLRMRVPELLILCDPSHLSGNRNYIHEVSQKALNLDFDGLFIESHCNPDEALSDALQQLSPEDLKHLLSTLVVPNSDIVPSGYGQTIEQLRARIDEIDDALLAQLALRFEICEEIGRFKKANNIAVLQSSRWDAVMDKVRKRAEELGLGKRFVEDIFSRIHTESIDRQSVE